jgi:hypothetical protein
LKHKNQAGKRYLNDNFWIATMDTSHSRLYLTLAGLEDTPDDITWNLTISGSYNNPPEQIPRKSF